MQASDIWPGGQEIKKKKKKKLKDGWETRPAGDVV